MRIRGLVLASATLLGGVGCAQGGEAIGVNSPPVPTAVACGDAPTLRQHAADARLGMGDVPGDRAAIIHGNRAKFLGSLAVVAALKCKAAAPEVEALIEQALAAGRAAETTRSEYDAARRWTEADLLATDAIALLVGQVPPPSAP